MRKIFVLLVVAMGCLQGIAQIGVRYEPTVRLSQREALEVQIEQDGPHLELHLSWKEKRG